MSESVFADLYDEKHRFIRQSTITGREKFEQKGMRERLFCQECETFFSRIELLATRSIEKAKAAADKSPAESMMILADEDGLNVWRFLLLTLFRASVASGEDWEEVSLAESEPALRDLVQADPDFDSYMSFPCVLFIGREPTDGSAVLIPPQQGQLAEHAVYKFYAPRLRWLAFVSESARNAGLDNKVPSNRGSGFRFRVRDEDEFNEAFVRRISEP